VKTMPVLPHSVQRLPVPKGGGRPISALTTTVEVAATAEEDPWASIGEQSLPGQDAQAISKSSDVMRLLTSMPLAGNGLNKQSKAQRPAPVASRPGEFSLLEDGVARPKVAKCRMEAERPFLSAGRELAFMRVQRIPRTLLAVVIFGVAMALGSYLRSAYHNPIQGGIVVAFGAVLALMLWLSGR
jgi:hypothetical protein